jgi:hypothetical protein
MRIAIGISISNKNRVKLFESNNYPGNPFRRKLEWKARRPDHWHFLHELQRNNFKALTE